MPEGARITWNGDRISAEVHAAAARGLLLAAEHVLGVSNQKVPLEEGTLERSGTASVDEGQLVAAISYDTPYAVRQHEEMTYRHAPGRQAKYLESALNEESATAQEIIAAQVRRAMGS